MRNKKDNIGIPEDIDLNELLNKMIMLQEGSKGTSFAKKVLYIFVGICSVMIVGLICVCIYKNNFSTESILSTLLAFFSIFISIFFYFKADETSTRFYDSSYKFMKDISVTLGKIEERFGEKLNSLNDKMSHFEKIKEETSEEIEGKEEDKDRMIEELMKRANLSDEERDTFKEEIAKREREIELLKEQRYRAERNAARLQRKMDSMDDGWSATTMLNRREMIELLENERLPDNLSIRTIESLKRRGYIDSEGRINRSAILKDIRKYEAI